MRKKVVLIDDDDVDNYTHNLIIKKTDFASVEKIFTDAREALIWFNMTERGISVIFLDINMPAMNGFEFLEEYNKISKPYQAETVVVMLTSSIYEKDAERSSQLGAKLTNKPLTFKFLEELFK